ncbi:bacteriorhodopsin [Pseudohoeflea coraliihabitans]|uniref:Bacteriorhodopsin n=1 Tax=Pseudohoeflea coraliihabitans TaxID=2860393 RepID=A0ABS6WV69_9HYPH|nr:bacteriorhodopsin [Pseudohoeflea sp. DP4N28-3]MBW3098955.1 bacteriorhodopsin [Pseudohoeflea sp. DP4N28-3]
MFTTLYTSQDVVSTSLTGLALMSVAAALLCFVGLSWSNERWRVPVAIVATACLVTALYYAGAAGFWLGGEKASAGVRFSAWYTVHPLQVAAVYFFARTQGPVPVGIFWRITGAAVLMTFGRWLGDASFFNPTLGVLISIGFWLYILGEMYFGAMTEAVRKSSRPVRLGFFWIRLLFTIGWAVYPILHFVDVVIGVGQAPGVIVLYNVFDIVNLIIPSLIVLAVAGQERY